MSYVTKAISGSELGKAIKSIATRGKKMDADINAASIQSLLQINDHNNCDYAGKLVKALPASTRKGDMVAYLCEHAPLVPQYKGKSRVFVGFKINKEDNAQKMNITGAEEKPFSEWVKEKPDPASFTLDKAQAQLKSLLKRSADKLPPHDLNALLDAMHSAHIEDVTSSHSNDDTKEVTTVGTSDQDKKAIAA